MVNVNIEALKQAALDVRLHAYAPYSGFCVGAALADASGRVHVGCNVENAAYGPTNCAERTALFRAFADGAKRGEFAALAVVADAAQPVSPCGVCRQVMLELCPPGMPVYMGNTRGQWRQTTVAALLPGAFSAEALDNKGEQS